MPFYQFSQLVQLVFILSLIAFKAQFQELEVENSYRGRWVPDEDLHFSGLVLKVVLKENWERRHCVHEQGRPLEGALKFPEVWEHKCIWKCGNNKASVGKFNLFCGLGLDINRLRRKDSARVETWGKIKVEVQITVGMIGAHVYLHMIMIQNYSRMEETPEKKLVSLLNRAAQSNRFSKALEVATEQYQIKPYNILKLTPTKILEIYRLITLKFYNTALASQYDSWYENQLRVFIWVLVVRSHLDCKPLLEMSEQDWGFFSEIFNGKNPDTFQFQALCLVKRRKSKKWGGDEIKMLVSIIAEKTEKNKWNEIAKAMFIRSQKRYFRTPKQCREQWINHLDPSKIKSEWTPLEDYEMIKTVLAIGKKWSLVARELGSKRTEHMVKNRFKSLLNAQSKKLDYEEKQQLLIFKIKQRLQASAPVKKCLQKKQPLKKEPMRKKKTQQPPSLQSQKGSSGIQQQLDNSEIQSSLSDKSEKQEDVAQVKIQNSPPNECSQKLRGEMGEQEIGQQMKCEQSWAWNPEPQIEDLINFNKFLYDKEEEQGQEDEFNYFFAPARNGPFKDEL